MKKNSSEIVLEDSASPHDVCLEYQNVSFEVHAPTHVTGIVNEDDKIVVEEHDEDKYMEEPKSVCDVSLDGCGVDLQTKTKEIRVHFSSSSVLENNMWEESITREDHNEHILSDELLSPWDLGILAPRNDGGSVDRTFSLGSPTSYHGEIGAT